MKRILLAACILLSACAGTPRPSTSDLSSGMTRQEVIDKLGQPVNVTMDNGTDYLTYRIHDHAYGRDNNFYAMGFRNGRLVSVNVLPEDQQEMGPIDRALRRPFISIRK